MKSEGFLQLVAIGLREKLAPLLAASLLLLAGFVLFALATPQSSNAGHSKGFTTKYADEYFSTGETDLSCCFGNKHFNEMSTGSFSTDIRVFRQRQDGDRFDFATGFGTVSKTTSYKAGKAGCNNLGIPTGARCKYA